jgi:hypothetical protein
MPLAAIGRNVPAMRQRHSLKEAKDIEPSLGIRLLADTRTIFGDVTLVMTTESLLRGLHDLPESPWSDLKGKPLTDRGLAHRLRQYGVKPKAIRVGDSTLRGYTREDLHDPWATYLPPYYLTEAQHPQQAKQTTKTPMF